MLNLKPPATSYEKLDDIGKYNMLWNVSLLLVPVFVLLFIMHIVFGDPSWTTSLTATCVAVFNVLVLYRTRKYKLIAYSSVIFGILICQAAIFLVDDSRVISDAMWCILVGFFTFFLLGNVKGMIVLMLNITGLLIYLINADVSQLDAGGFTPDMVDYKMIANVYYVAIALAFIVIKMMNNTRDIYARYEREIAHNEILLKEIHHRVKNNMQIVSSLLRLQASEAAEGEVKEHFNEAIGRIRSMALIHERMYNNDDLSSIDITSYLELLASDILESNKSECNVTFNVASDIGQIDIKSIVPISLIFNELITNSVKHGFKGKSLGTIDVEIMFTDENIMFIYSDNGDWIDASNSSSFGLELIKTLTDQLEGFMKREINNGTHYRFDFKPDSLLFKADK